MEQTIAWNTQKNEARHELAVGAFHVTKSASANNLAYHATLMFDSIQFDPGSEYSVTSGHYRCPVSGTYVFHVGIMTDAT